MQKLWKKWYKKYNSVKEDHESFRRNFNPLYEILNSNTPTFNDRFEDDFNTDIDEIQKEFYNYYYGYYIDAALSFINDQYQEIEPSVNKVATNKNNDNAVNATETAPVVNESTDTQSDSTKEFVEEHIKCFKGRKKGHGKIMNEKDYDKLLNYTTFLIKEDKLPKNIKPIPKVALSNEFIRYTFYKMHRELNSRKIKDSWIDFLHAVFMQFANTSKQTTKTKFSQYNKNGSYEKDKADITNYK